MAILIRAFDQENIHLMKNLLAEALGEGHDFVERTLAEWMDGSNDFSRPGEMFFGAYDKGNCVGMGGLNIDPYTDEPGGGGCAIYTFRPNTAAKASHQCFCKPLFGKRSQVR